MKRLLALLLALATVLTLPACGKKNAAPDDTPETPVTADDAGSVTAVDYGTNTPDTVPGTYQLLSMIEEGEAIDTDALAAMEQTGLICTLQLRENGTGVLDLFGEETEFTWTENTFLIDGEHIPFTLSDGLLSIEQDTSSMTFSKVSDNIVEVAVETVDLASAAEGLSNDIPGTYILYGMTSDEQEFDEETMQMMRAMGLTCALLLNENGTGTFYLFSTVFDLTWDEHNLYSMKGDESSSSPLPFTLKDHVITLEKDGSVLRFLKTSDEIEELPKPIDSEQEEREELTELDTKTDEE